MRVFFCTDERKMLRSKKSVRGFSGGAGESAVTKKRGQRGKRLIERNFLTTEEKFSFLYCEFYSEQKILQKSSIVRKSIRKKQKVLREIFSAAKIAQKKQKVIIYIEYTKRQIKSCASGETGREGERGGRRNTAFLKCRLPKGDAEPQVIIFIKMQKKTLNSPTAGVY